MQSKKRNSPKLMVAIILVSTVSVQMSQLKRQFSQKLGYSEYKNFEIKNDNCLNLIVSNE